MHYYDFSFDVTALALAGYQLHFDLYKTGTGNGGTSDLDIVDFAPFSHDAQSGPPVPEPATMLLVGSGLIGIAGIKRRNS